MRNPAGVKIWMRSRLFGASATAKVPFGSTANAVGSMMRPASPPMWTISHALACCASSAEDHVRAAIEDEVLTGRGLLKAGRLAELAGDVRRNGAGRSQHVRLERAERGGAKTEAAENAETAEDQEFEFCHECRECTAADRSSASRQPSCQRCVQALSSR